MYNQILHGQSRFIINWQTMQNYQEIAWEIFQQIKEAGLTIAQQQNFQYYVIGVTILVSFILGRVSHEKKLTHLLEGVNDVEASKKRLTQKLQSQKKRLASLKSKKKIVLILFFGLLIANGSIYYFNQQIDFYYLVVSGGVFLCYLLMYYGLQKLFQISKQTTERRLQSISLTAQNEINQIIRFFGQGLKQELKAIYSEEISSRLKSEEKQQCKLYTCFNEKRSFQQLFNIYEEIIEEIKKVTLCEICLTQQNISVQQLNMTQLSNFVKLCRKSKGGKLNLGQKKQMVNKLLSQYNRVFIKLPQICKKGCCIKQREIIEMSKQKWQQKINQVYSKMNSFKKA